MAGFVCLGLDRLVTVAASAAIMAATSAATPAFLCLKAVAAENRTIAARFEGNSRLLAAAGAGHCCAGAGALRVSTAAAIGAATVTTAATGIGLLGLPAGLAALGRGVSPFREERLISSRKCKFPPAVATGQLQVTHCIPRFDLESP